LKQPLQKIAEMQNGRPLSPRAQDSSAQIESSIIRAVPERSFASVDQSTNELPSNRFSQSQGWQANFNEPINQPITLPPISRSARTANSVITNQPASTRWQGTLGSAGENHTQHSLSNHPRLTSENIPPTVPPRPKSTLTSKSRLTTMSLNNRISPSPNRPVNMSHSSGPGRGLTSGGGTLISQSQNINLPNVSPPPIPTTTTSNTSNTTFSNVSSSDSQNALSSLTHAPVNISLVAPRPGPDRVQNLYVDAPLKSTVITNNQQNDLLTGSRTNIHGITTSPSSTANSNSSSTSSTSATVTLPKCRKGHLTDQFDTLSSINCSKTHSSSNHTSHHRSHHHRHHHSHHHQHQQKSQALSSKLHSSVIQQQPTNHSLLQSSPSADKSNCSTLKKNFDLIEEDSKISPVLNSDLCPKCCKFQHPGTSGHLLCPDHGSSPLSERSNSSRFNLISTFEAPLPRPTSTLPTLPLNSSIRSDQSDSIICRECGKCRCEACRAPRKLPEYWLCGNACVCSSETVVDTISCMCCVKTMFYHCGKDCYLDESTVEDSTNAFDRPCSCSGEHACARWSFMGVLGMILPCLWCYLPLKGCAKVTQSIYQRCTATGCRCVDSTQNLESPSGNVAPVLPPKMSDNFVGSKTAPLPGPKAVSSPCTTGSNSIRDNSSITSSPTIPSLSSPADSEKRLLD